MDKTKREIELLNKIFDEEQRRAEVEKEAEALFIKGDFKKFNELLSSLDDSIILGLRAELAALDDEPEQQRQPQKNTEQENKKLKNTLQQIIHETCEDICDNYCKYRDTTDEDYLCDITRDGGDCPLDRIYV